MDVLCQVLCLHVYENDLIKSIFKKAGSSFIALQGAPFYQNSNRKLACFRTLNYEGAMVAQDLSSDGSGNGRQYVSKLNSDFKNGKRKLIDSA